MKKQSGFTLIELLLVLAIIGIISAIAIPALLGQRARARDKSSIANADSIIADLVSGYDKAKEAGTAMGTPAAFSTAVLGTIAVPLVPQFFTAPNPWGLTATGYNQTVATETDSLGTGVKLVTAAANQGQVSVGFMPVAAGGSGATDAAVYVNATFKDATGTATNTYLKVAGLE